VSHPSEPILAVEGLVKSFGGVRAVNDCSFTVAPGSITGLIGPNGSGKTTTFNLITGLETPEAGRITFEGRDIAGTAPHAITRLGVGRTFQVTRVFAQMTVLENMMVAAPDDDLADATDRAMQLLEMVGLIHLRDEFGASLSYGQNKLVEIARVHMRPNHDLVLLDEPFAGVNRTLAEQLVGYINRMRDEEGVTYLLIDHEMKLVMRLCGHILVMEEGRLLTEGPPEVVQENDDVLAAYFGRE
jgi:ABC-type branched-subunit amino acid transport system ATPase component